jgi:hypothetical protein
MDVDGADERGVGETEIDRSAQRVDPPFVLDCRLRDAGIMCEQESAWRAVNKQPQRCRTAPCRREYLSPRPPNANRLTDVTYRARH